MAEIARREVEILVHTTAQSRGQDDARYRAFAQAYLDFSPATSKRLDKEPQDTVGHTLKSGADVPLQMKLLHPTQEDRESRASYHPDDEDEHGTSSSASLHYESSNQLSVSQYMESPHLSFQSVLDNADSPAFHNRSTTHNENGPITPDELPRAQSSAGSWQLPPSTVADSQPENERDITVFCSPTRVLESYLQSQSKFADSPPQLPKQGFQKRCIVGASRILSLSSENDVPPSSPSPQKNPLPDHATGPKERDADPSTKRPYLKRRLAASSSQDANISVSDLPNIAMETSSHDQLARLQKRQRVALTSSQEVEPTAITTSRMRNEVLRPTSGSIASDWSHTSEIRPPLPPTSVTELTPEKLITEPLQSLAQRMSRGNPFKPIEWLRELRPLERGYWLVNCQKWDEKIRTICWNFLGNFVGKGKAGWGVSCIMDAENCPGTIRVYCWGIVVEHIYLVLFMASASKIKGTGACWISGDGTAIIKMPS